MYSLVGQVHVVMKLSIIIPTLTEGRSLEGTFAPISDHAHEIIVVDGGSDDDTLEIARQYTPKVFYSNRGRGIQQHTGACHAQGDVLLFLHADTLLPKGFGMEIERILSDPEVSFGAFRLGYQSSTTPLNLIAVMANHRSLLLKMPYGDQGLFMRRTEYFLVKGFKDLPIMEDVDLVRRLKRIGRFKLTRGRVRTSVRRYEKEGIFYATVRNWSLIIRYLLGVSPQRLHRLYSDTR